jgi:uncharacterized membrane protein YeiH
MLASYSMALGAGDGGPRAGNTRRALPGPSRTTPGSLSSNQRSTLMAGNPHGFDPTLILWLNLVGTFVFGLSGGLAAVRAGLDIFGVLVLSAVVALAGGITRDLLIGTPPATFRDWRYLAAVGAAGLVCFFAQPALERQHVQRAVLVFDAAGLAIFAVTGATKGLDFHLGPVQAILLGAITGIGGGMLRDVLLRDVPTVLRHDLYAIPALLGATVLVIAQKAGSSNPLWPLLGAVACFTVRLLALRFGIDAPVAPSERRRPRD